MPRRAPRPANSAHMWLDHVQPTGLVVSTLVLGEQGLTSLPQTAADSVQFDPVPDARALFADILGWPAARVAGGFGNLPLPPELTVSLADHDTLLEATMAVRNVAGDGWQLLVRVEDDIIELDRRGALAGWEATPHQRFERLLRETGVGVGVLIGDGHLRLVTSPRGETSGWIDWPLASLATVAGRDMLGGLKLLLGTPALFTAPAPARLPQLLAESRRRQAEVSKALSGQVLEALHRLLRGFTAAEPALIADLAEHRPQDLYEGLLSVLLRLVFILYAEDRDLLPSVRSPEGIELYEQGYSLRGLLVQLDDDAALHPDTMDERRGAWGRLLALFGLMHGGYDGFMQGRGGTLFDPAAFPFLMGNRDAAEPDRVPRLSDGCIHGVLRALMVVRGERLSYRTLDVEQIGSVYETVMGFTVEQAAGRSLAIKGGKNNRTPVFVDLDRLATLSAADRLKALKDDAGRGTLGARVERGVRSATTADELAVALGDIADSRGSPNAIPVALGVPILQPTDERRRTGSHYTPRELTAPIVAHALEPAFARIGDRATPDEVLSLKVCDPAMGSGAFLVEACRQLGARLVLAWEAHPALKPTPPADEDDDLHARRLVAQRCLYGVDRNPMAVDLAKLSLWLATLASRHEFSFLDHALKCGDSLVGLSRVQIEGATFAFNPPPTLWRLQVRQLVDRSLAHREAIRTAADDVALAMQEARHREAERDLANVRLIGDAAVATFFAHDKPKARLNAVAELADRAGSAAWEYLHQHTAPLEHGPHPIRPFHWEIEFPEVFARDNGGYDALVGNPPFLGGTLISGRQGSHYLEYLLYSQSYARDRADLVAHFFVRAVQLCRKGGCLGFVTTNSITQGDSQIALQHLVSATHCQIVAARRRLPWPGEAAVVVATIHLIKDPYSLPIMEPILDGNRVTSISSYLVADVSGERPTALRANQDCAFEGYAPYGPGFLFADDPSAYNRLEDKDSLLLAEPHASMLVKRYVGGSDILQDPFGLGNRYALFCGQMSEQDLRDRFPHSYKIIEEKVKPERLSGTERVANSPWWQFLWSRPKLTKSLSGLDRMIVRPKVATHHAFAFLDTEYLPSNATAAICLSTNAAFATLQSRSHEVWARFFGSSMKDDLRYTPSDCFETFPFPVGYERSPALETSGHAYHDHRAKLMIARNQGMTPTYNLFHKPDDADADIAELRTLHAAMDDAVLRAYGWDDLADACAPGEWGAPVFLDDTTEDDHKYQKRLFWPAAMRDAVLARLFRLNEERASAEKAATKE